MQGKSTVTVTRNRFSVVAGALDLSHNASRHVCLKYDKGKWKVPQFWEAETGGTMTNFVARQLMLSSTEALIDGLKPSIYCNLIITTKQAGMYTDEPKRKSEYL